MKHDIKGTSKKRVKLKSNHKEESCTCGGMAYLNYGDGGFYVECQRCKRATKKYRDLVHAKDEWREGKEKCHTMNI